MKKNIIGTIIFSFLILFFTGCNDPVFYEVSMQIKSPEPRIKGSPTNFAAINDVLYVASGNSVHIYYENNNSWFWTRTDPSLGRINFLAATDTQLFIITPAGLFTSSSLYKINDAPPENPSNATSLRFNTTPITYSGHRFISMYSANNEIFIGAMKDNSSYAILHNTGSALNEVNITYTEYTKNGLLNGVVYNGTDYFFSVKDQVYNSNDTSKTPRVDRVGGIYQGTTASANLIDDNYSIAFMGIISIGNNLIAIDRSGNLYNAETLASLSISTGKISNGVLQVVNAYNASEKKWNGAPLLLAGRQDALQYDVYTGYTYGYLEIELDGDNIKSGGSFREPGITGTDAPSTLIRTTGSNDTFKTTIGTYAIRFIYQSNDSYKTIFTSTHQNGVWSLRDQNDSNKDYPYWNTES
ncbi:MAG: hypothetical protein LBU88_03585 [Treponema sp.]|jgi:hypothetical protein|nr:hypothetical protein [Treponema sp.]